MSSFSSISCWIVGAGCSVSPVLNLPRHLLCSVFGRSEFHGKLVCRTHGPIAVFFCQVGRRSNLCNDSLRATGGASWVGRTMTTSTRSPASACNAPSISSGTFASAETALAPTVRANHSSSCACGGALGSVELVSRPIVLTPGSISRANSICFAGNPSTYGSIPVTLPPGRASLAINPR